MKTSIANVIKRLPLFGKLAVASYSYYLRVQNRKVIRRNAKLKGICAGKRCFILATGPSIKTQDLSKLKGELSISVSNFFVHPSFKDITPAFHIFAASHPPITDEQFGKLFQDAELHFPKGQKVFISITDKHIVEKIGTFKNQEVFYYSLGHKPLTNSIDFARDIPTIQTSPHIAIYLALYLGVSEINLLGVDHDWLLHLGETRHFYNEKESSLSRTGLNEWFEEDLELQFSSHVHLWQVYKRIRKFCATRSTTVFNLSPVSLLDIFPKKSLTEITERIPIIK